jgi:opacity protein-like surface antigen
MKKLLTTLAMLTAIATPALAQYAPQDYQSSIPPSVQQKNAARQSGVHAYAMVPRAPAGTTLDDPSFTGGGSAGYNVLSRSY